MENQSDHDLLVRLDEQMVNIRNDIKELKDGTTSKIDDHESRIKTLEISKARYFWTMTIYSAIGATLIGLLVYHLFQS